MKRLCLAAAAALVLATPARADEVTDTLQGAIEAYQAGDIAFALQDLAYATQLLNALKAEGLAAFLPPAPDGWTRNDNADAGQSLGFIGGGSAAEANYVGEGREVTLTLMADNPMVTAMAGMFGNATLMAQAGKVTRVGRFSFVDQGGDISGLVGNRVLVQAKGDAEAAFELLGAMDLRGLSDFGS